MSNLLKVMIYKGRLISLCNSTKKVEVSRLDISGTTTKHFQELTFAGNRTCRGFVERIYLTT